MGAHIPELHGAVIARGHCRLAIGRKRNPIDVSGVTFERTQAVACGSVPQAHGFVLAGRGDSFSIGAEGGITDLVRMAPEDQPRKVTDMPEIMPFERTQVLLPFLRHVAFQQTG